MSLLALLEQRAAHTKELMPGCTSDTCCQLETRWVVASAGSDQEVNSY